MAINNSDSINNNAAIDKGNNTNNSSDNNNSNNAAPLVLNDKSPMSLSSPPELIRGAANPSCSYSGSSAAADTHAIVRLGTDTSTRQRTALALASLKSRICISLALHCEATNLERAQELYINALFMMFSPATVQEGPPSAEPVTPSTSTSSTAQRHPAENNNVLSISALGAFLLDHAGAYMFVYMCLYSIWVCI